MLPVIKLPQIVAVTFDARVYSKRSAQSRKGFEFPISLARAFGWRRGKPLSVDLWIARLSSGDLVSSGTFPFVSGTEIRDPDLFQNVEFGESIRVTARPAKRK